MKRNAGNERWRWKRIAIHVLAGSAAIVLMVVADVLFPDHRWIPFFVGGTWVALAASDFKKF